MVTKIDRHLMLKYFCLLPFCLTLIFSQKTYGQYSYSYKTNAYLQKDKFSFTKQEILKGQVIQLSSPNAMVISCQVYFSGDTLKNVHAFAIADSLKTLNFFYSKLVHSPYQITFDNIQFRDEKGKIEHANGFTIDVH